MQYGIARNVLFCSEISLKIIIKNTCVVFVQFDNIGGNTALFVMDIMILCLHAGIDVIHCARTHLSLVLMSSTSTM